jgi:hypothetical protein
MILLDFSQVAISNLHQQIKVKKGVTLDVNPPLLRHMILNSIRKIRREFGLQYGKLVVCTDSHNYWRKSAFKQYKANRKKDRDASGIDWNLVFGTLNDLRADLREYFPYKVMEVVGAEADDVIGVIAKHYHPTNKIIIISGDKDFQQLQKYPNVDQYSPVQDKFLKPENPALFLKEHILRGDKGDGIPNFLSDDDCLVAGIRQASIYEVKLTKWLHQQPEEFCDEKTLKNYERNRLLVDLDCIPANVEADILAEYKLPIVGSRDKIFGYLVQNKMRNLMDQIQEF